MKPTFLFIGPDKTGSTWLYEILRQHPDCYVPPCKDIYFFDRYYDRGLDWYFSFFRRAPAGVRAVGELSHDYLFSPQVAERIAHDLPGIKLLTCLRNPVERTFSHYLYLIRSGRTVEPFEVALDKFPELINNSMYYKNLSEYFRRFDSRQIKVLFFDLLQSDPEAFAKSVFDFLGLTFIQNIEYSKKVRVASQPRSYLLARLAKSGANLARFFDMTNLVGVVKRSTLVQMLYMPYRHHERPMMDASTQEQLTVLFQPDILRLQSLLGEVPFGRSACIAQQPSAMDGERHDYA